MTSVISTAQDAELHFENLCDKFYHTDLVEYSTNNVIRELEEAHHVHVNVVKREFNATLDVLERAIEQQKVNYETQHERYIANVKKMEQAYEEEFNRINNEHKSELKRIQVELNSNKSTLPLATSVISQLHEDQEKEIRRINAEWTRILENKQKEMECVQRKNDELNTLHKQNVHVFDATIREKDEMITSLQNSLHEMENNVEEIKTAHRDEMRRVMQEHASFVKQSSLLLQSFEAREGELSLLFSRLRTFTEMSWRLASPGLSSQEKHETSNVSHNETNNFTNAKNESNNENGMTNKTTEQMQKDTHNVEGDDNNAGSNDNKVLQSLVNDTLTIKNEIHQLTQTFAEQIASQLSSLRALQKEKSIRLSVDSNTRYSMKSNSSSMARDGSVWNAFNDILDTRRTYYNNNSNINNNNNNSNSHSYAHKVRSNDDKEKNSVHVESTANSSTAYTPHNKELYTSYLHSVTGTSVNKETDDNHRFRNVDNNTNALKKEIEEVSPIPIAPTPSPLALLEVETNPTSNTTAAAEIHSANNTSASTLLSEQQQQQEEHRETKTQLENEQHVNTNDNEKSKPNSYNADKLQGLEINGNGQAKSHKKSNKKVIRRLFSWQEKRNAKEEEEKITIE